MIAAALRQGMMGASGYTAKDYVHDGLIAMWDGIENAGFAADGIEHDQNATVWKDLIEAREFVSVGNSRLFGWEDDCYHFDTYGTKETARWKYILDQELLGVFNSGEICIEAVIAGDNIARNSQHLLTSTGSKYSNDFNCNSSGITNFFQQSVLGVRNVYSSSVRVGKATFCSYGTSVRSRIYANGVNVTTSGGRVTGTDQNVVGDSIFLGCTSTSGSGRDAYFRLYSLRIYSRALTDPEIAANYAIDKARFGLT